MLKIKKMSQNNPNEPEDYTDAESVMSEDDTQQDERKEPKEEEGFLQTMRKRLGRTTNENPNKKQNGTGDESKTSSESQGDEPDPNQKKLGRTRRRVLPDATAKLINTIRQTNSTFPVPRYVMQDYELWAYMTTHPLANVVALFTLYMATRKVSMLIDDSEKAKEEDRSICPLNKDSVKFRINKFLMGQGKERQWFWYVVTVATIVMAKAVLNLVHLAYHINKTGHSKAAIWYLYYFLQLLSAILLAVAYGKVHELI